MTSRKIIRIALVTVTISSAVVLAEPPVTQLSGVDRLEQSKAVWLKLKAASGGNYEYDVKFQSWVGFGHTTTVVVKGGKVVERRLVKFRNRPVKVRITRPGEKPVPVKPPKPEGWTETGDKIGTNRGGAPAKTIDALYDDAKKILTGGVPPRGKLYVKYHSNGVLRYCFWVDTRIADDAPRNGPLIDVIRMGKPAATQPRQGPQGPAKP